MYEKSAAFYDAIYAGIGKDYQEESDRIAALIIVEKPGQKKIVIGRGGQNIKQMGIQARKEIESLLQVRQVYLELTVKVVPGWRNKKYFLDSLGVQ